MDVRDADLDPRAREAALRSSTLHAVAIRYHIRDQTHRDKIDHDDASHAAISVPTASVSPAHASSARHEKKVHPLPMLQVAQPPLLSTLTLSNSSSSFAASAFCDSRAGSQYGSRANLVSSPSPRSLQWVSASPTINSDYLSNIINSARAKSLDKDKTATGTKHLDKPVKPEPSAVSSVGSVDSSHFDFICSKEGAACCLRWFEEHSRGAMNELRFVEFVRTLAPYVAEHDILDAFDLFDEDGSGFVSFGCFYLLLALFAAQECCQGTKFMSTFGHQMYDLFKADSASAAGISTERFKGLGRLYGFTDNQLTKLLIDHNISISDLVAYEDFLLLYVELFSQWDNWRMECSHPVQTKPSCCCTIL